MSIADADAHELFDRTAAASEAYHVVGWSREEIRGVLGIEEDVLEHDPLADRRGVVAGGWDPWEPWDADVAAERFLIQWGCGSQSGVARAGL